MYLLNMIDLLSNIIIIKNDTKIKKMFSNLNKIKKKYFILKIV